MHPAIEILPEQALLHVRVSGAVTGAELVAINADAAAQLDCKFQLWQFIDIESICVSPDEMHTLARQDWTCSLNSQLEKVALVGEAADLRPILDFYELYSKYWVGRPNDFLSEQFETPEQAMAWFMPTASQEDPRR